MRARLFLPLFLAAVLSLGASDCGDATNRTLLSLNDLQDAAGHALLEAKGKVEANGLACGKAARLAVPPVAPSPAACAALGFPFPFDPVATNEAIGYSNAAYEAIRVANAAKKAVAAGTGTPEGTAEAVTQAVVAVQRLYRAAKDLGIGLDYPKAEKALSEAQEASSR